MTRSGAVAVRGALFVNDADGNGAGAQKPSDLPAEFFVVRNYECEELCHGNRLLNQPNGCRKGTGRRGAEAAGKYSADGGDAPDDVVALHPLDEHADVVGDLQVSVAAVLLALWMNP